MIRHLLVRIPVLSLTLAASLLASSSAYGSTTIMIQNNDQPNVGFNDPTPVPSVGGNNGPTLGQQRLNAFQFAANIWGATLPSGPTILVRASWSDTMTCSENAGVLGSAGAVSIRSGFANAPFSDTWYSAALANKISGDDLNGTTAEISAQFNSRIGTTECLQNSSWYLGLDNNHGNGIDLVTVLLHELAHGLGFQTFTDSSTGAQISGMPSIYDRFLRDNSTGKLWVDMNDTERIASAINTGNLVWNGAQVIADVPNVLATPRLRVNPPSAIAGNYVVGTAEFGPRLSSPGVTNNVAQATPADGCTAIGGSVSGKIAFIDRGTCNFTVKVKNAQNAGATGVIIANVPSTLNPDIPPEMGGSDPTILIPAVSLSLADGNSIRTALLGSTVNATLLLDHTVFSGADSSNRARMFAPNPVDDGSSVSHFDKSAFPNLLMEPDNSADLTHSVIPPQDLTLSLLRDIGWTASSTSATIQLSASSYSFSEGAGALNVSVTRSGNTSEVASVTYRTVDDTAEVRCDVFNGTAYPRCDYSTTVDKLTFAIGETSKTFSIPTIDDAYAEGNETFSIALSNAIGATLGARATATVTITDNETVNGTNPIFTTPFFVRQHYLDFLSREPEAGEPWSGVLNNCSDVNNNPACDRLTVSAAFFGSPEFQLKGFFVYRFYKLAFNRLPSYTEIVTDMRAVTGQTSNEVFQKKAEFTNAFVLRTEFDTYNNMTNATFVSTLMARYGLAQITTPDPAAPDGSTKVTLTTADLTNRLNGIGGTLTRAQVLRAIADSDQVFIREFNPAFVAMQYYGYLRRAPETAGYNGWLNYLNANPTDSRTMVNGFMNSLEYRLRFGP